MAAVFKTHAGKILREELRRVIEDDVALDAAGGIETTEGLWRKVGYRQFAIQLVAAGEVDIHHVRGRERKL